MITYSALTHFTQQRINTMCLNYERAYSRPSEEAIHDLRVSVRRLMSHLNFLSFLADQDQQVVKEYAALYKKLKRYLKSMNQLRDLQIQIQYIEKQAAEKHIPQNLLAALKSEETGRLSRITSKMDKWKLRKIRITIRRLLQANAVSDRELELKCSLYLNFLTEEVHSAVCDCTKPDIIGCHRLRIRLKEYRYHLEMLEQGFNIRQLLIGAVKNWQDELGALQDMRMLLEKLRELESAGDPEIIAFRHHIQSELDALLDIVKDEVYAIRFETQLKK